LPFSSQVKRRPVTGASHPGYRQSFVIAFTSGASGVGVKGLVSSWTYALSSPVNGLDAPSIGRAFAAGLICTRSSKDWLCSVYATRRCPRS